MINVLEVKPNVSNMHKNEFTQLILWYENYFKN